MFIKRIISVVLSGIVLFTGVSSVAASSLSVKPELETGPNAVLEIPTSVVTEKPELPQEYSLPYPGILSDHPLYFIKVLRDFIVEMNINDPVRKAKFSLLQSDKNLSMAIEYQKRGQGSHAVERFVISQPLMSKAVRFLKKANETGRDIPAETLSSFVRSIARHVEYADQFPEIGNNAQGKEAVKQFRILQSDLNGLFGK